MVVTGGAVLATLLGCTPAGAERPDATAVVSQYLEAIASGDATAARELDRAAVEDENAGEPETDLDTLRTDEVLGAAGRITGVEVDPETSSDVSGDDGDRLVSYRFDLDGEPVESTLSVSWNDEAQTWDLTQSLARRMWVTAGVNRTISTYVGFSVPGATVPQPTDESAATPYFLAYPGVYSVTADLDPALLVDHAAGLTQQTPIGAEFETVVDFAVTALP